MLPESLREAIASDTNDFIIRQAAAGEHLPPDKIPSIARVVGLVLTGFIHAEDIVQELKDRSFPPQTAANIANALSVKIFKPLKDDLDKIYAPVPHEGETPTIEEIKKAAAPPGMPVFITAPKETKAEAPPASLGGASAIPKPSHVQGPVGEFARLGLEKTETLPPAIMPAPATGPRSEKILVFAAGKSLTDEPPPVMIFGAGEAKPSEAASKFRMEMPPLPKFSETKPPSGAPPRPAVIEWSGQKQPEPSRQAPPPPMPKVVHYTEFRTEVGKPTEPSKSMPVPPAPQEARPPVPQKQILEPSPTTPPKRIEPPPIRRPATTPDIKPPAQ